MTGRVLAAALVLLSTGCVVGGTERWQRTRTSRNEVRVQIEQQAAVVERDGEWLRVAAVEVTRTEWRTLRTYRKMREEYRAGGDLDELFYGLAWGVFYCTGGGLIYDLVSTVAYEHAFPGLRTIALGLVPGVHDATLRGLFEDHRLTDEVATGETEERPEGPWKTAEVGQRALAGLSVTLRCGERRLGRSRTDADGSVRWSMSELECAQVACLEVLLDGQPLPRLEESTAAASR
ncbi:MAG: hypothetical protein ACYTFT_16570 [Planctomycetota bacterium]